MMELYISNCQKLAYNKKALKIVHNSNIIDGVELSDISEEFLIFKKSGIKISTHIPGLHLTLNLARKDFMNCFDGSNGRRLLRSIKMADSPIIGLHLGYSAERIYKMYSCPNIPVGSTLIIDRDELMNRICDNVISFRNVIEHESANRTIVLEGLDYSREMEIKWEIQPYESKISKNEILQIISTYGINAGLLHVTDPSFSRELLEKINENNALNEVGYLLDICHTYITADAKIFAGEYSGTIENYFEFLISDIGMYIKQLHISVPREKEGGGFNDEHGKFVDGDILTEHIIELTKFSIEHSPNLRVITLEMKTNLDPINHVTEMEKQFTYLMKKITF